MLAPAPAAAQDRQEEEGGEYRHQPPSRAEPAPEPPRRSVDLAPNARLGFGIFPIVGQTDKEVLRRRTHAGPEVRRKGGRVGGLGFSLRF